MADSQYIQQLGQLGSSYRKVYCPGIFMKTEEWDKYEERSVENTSNDCTRCFIFQTQVHGRERTDYIIQKPLWTYEAIGRAVWINYFLQLILLMIVPWKKGKEEGLFFPSSFEVFFQLCLIRKFLYRRECDGRLILHFLTHCVTTLKWTI